jgi:hypothetical protein
VEVGTITVRTADTICLMLQTSMENVLALAGDRDQREAEALAMLSELVARAALHAVAELGNRKRIDSGLGLSLVLSDVEVRMRQALSQCLLIEGSTQQ